MWYHKIIYNLYLLLIPLLDFFCIFFFLLSSTCPIVKLIVQKLIDGVERWEMKLTRWLLMSLYYWSQFHCSILAKYLYNHTDFDSRQNGTTQNEAVTLICEQKMLLSSTFEECCCMKAFYVKPTVATANHQSVWYHRNHPVNDPEEPLKVEPFLVVFVDFITKPELLFPRFLFIFMRFLLFCPVLFRQHTVEVDVDVESPLSTVHDHCRQWSCLRNTNLVHQTAADIKPQQT